MLGVVITAGSFILLRGQPHALPQAANGAQGIGTDMFRVELFYGVLFGAVLGLVNHVFVLGCTNALHAVLAGADDAYPDWIEKEPAARIDDLVAHLKTAVIAYDRDLGDAFSRLVKGTATVQQNIEEATKRMQAAGKSIDVAAVALTKELGKLSGELGAFASGLHTAVDTTATRMDQASKSIAAATQGFGQASGEFANMPQSITHASQTLHAAIEQLSRDSAQLHSATERSTQAIGRIADEVPEAILARTRGVTSAMQTAEQELATASAALATALRASVASIPARGDAQRGPRFGEHSPLVPTRASHGPTHAPIASGPEDPSVRPVNPAATGYGAVRSSSSPLRPHIRSNVPPMAQEPRLARNGWGLLGAIRGLWGKKSG